MFELVISEAEFYIAVSFCKCILINWEELFDWGIVNKYDIWVVI